MIKSKAKLLGASLLALTLLSGCNGPGSTDSNSEASQEQSHQSTMADVTWANEDVAKRYDIYTDYTLQADLSNYSDNQRKLLGLLIDASKIMDDLYWKQAYGDKESLLNSISDDKARHFAEINYGAWDRMGGDQPFLSGYEDKPLGAQFYPEDMTKEEFQAAEFDNKVNLYSLVKRDDNGKLYSLPYHVAYKTELEKASALLKQAAALAETDSFKHYLTLRAEALVTDDYQESDMAWMDMKDNPIEIVIGAIETYEDLLFGYRTSYESYVLLKDMQWSKKLSRFASFLPELQAGLPVEPEYKKDIVGTQSDLNAYDVLYYAGHSNSGSKTIAINLPNDEQVQLSKGTRRLQLKNAMKAKFDKILVPISEVLIVPEQRQHITFNAFFANTMFHEVAHGLGIKNTINGKGFVRTALKEMASPYEEGKADILGLYMIQKLHEKGEITEGSLMDYYVTFMAGIFRSSRFGVSNAHGKANMLRFNYFKDKGAFARNEAGQYSIDKDKFEIAIKDLSKLILTLQGNGDYEQAKELLNSKGIVSEDLAQDFERLANSNIPVDIYFNQGKEVLGLK